MRKLPLLALLIPTLLILMNRSIDASWTATELVSIDCSATSAHPSLDIESDGTVHIARQDGTRRNDWDIFYKRYEPGTGWTSYEIGADYHAIFGEDVQFLHGHAGIILKF